MPEIPEARLAEIEARWHRAAAAVVRLADEQATHDTVDIVCSNADVPDLVREVRRLRTEQVAAVLAWEEYGRWPGMYGSVPVGRVRHHDGREEEIALRADQITGITRGIERHVKSLLPYATDTVNRMRLIPALEDEVRRLREENAEYHREWDKAKVTCQQLADAAEKLAEVTEERVEKLRAVADAARDASGALRMLAGVYSGRTLDAEKATQYADRLDAALRDAGRSG